MNDMSLGAASPKLAGVVGRRAKEMLSKMSQEEREQVKAALVKQLVDAEPTISAVAAMFGAERILSSGMTSIPQVTTPNTVFVTWLGYKQYQDPQLRYFSSMRNNTKYPESEPNTYAAQDVSGDGAKYAKFMYMPRHVARVFEWASRTASYRTKDTGARIAPHPGPRESLPTGDGKDTVSPRRRPRTVKEALAAADRRAKTSHNHKIR